MYQMNVSAKLKSVASTVPEIIVNGVWGEDCEPPNVRKRRP